MTHAFHVDADPVKRWGRKASTQWDAISDDEHGRALQRGGHRARNAGNRRVKRWSGELQDTSLVTTTKRGPSHEVQVLWPAKQAHWVERGRRAFSAPEGRMLRWETRTGEVVFAKSVKAAPAQWFARRGLQDARTGIRQEVADGTRRAIRRFEALG